MPVGDSVQQMARVMAPIFMRNGSQTTPPSSSALSTEPQTSRSRQRSLGTARRRDNSTTTENDALVAADADDIHSPPLKKARATERCCPCTLGVCTYGGGSNNSAKGCPCRRAGKNCSLACARPDCRNFSAVGAPLEPSATVCFFTTEYPPEPAPATSRKLWCLFLSSLQKRKGVTRARDIKLRLEKCLAHWEKGSYRDLVNDVVNHANGGSTSCSTPTEESFARAYNAPTSLPPGLPIGR
jgi:hypothetical protein